MKISVETFEILKNFCGINSSIVVKKGNELRTVSEQKHILSRSVVKENFPKNFAVYDLNQFLGLVSLFKDPEFDFEDKMVVIKEDSVVSKYMYSDPSIITAAPDKNLELPSVECEIDITKESLKQIINAAYQLALPEISVRGDGETISLNATDIKNPSTNEFSVEVGKTDKKYNFVFKVDNFKFIPDNYKVKITEKGFGNFVGTKAEYWVALESSSKYEG